jgi:hypothetical protein
VANIDLTDETAVVTLAGLQWWTGSSRAELRRLIAAGIIRPMPGSRNKFLLRQSVRSYLAHWENVVAAALAERATEFGEPGPPGGRSFDRPVQQKRFLVRRRAPGNDRSRPRRISGASGGKS